MAQALCASPDRGRLWHVTASIAPDEIPAAVQAWLPEHYELRSPEHGATADVVLVESTTAPSLVLKRCTRPPYTDWLENEYRALEALAAAELPIPRALGLYRESEEAPVWLAMTMLPGTPLWDVVERASEEERVALFEQLGRLLGRIHCTPVPAELPVEEDHSNWLDRAYRRAASYVRRHVAMALPERLARRLRGGEAMPRTLVHGDFTLDNVLAEDGQITGVIDWGGASAADPRWDVTLALATEPEIHLPPRAVAAFFTGYRAAPLPEALDAAMGSAYGWSES
jgi:aminoglycoside phosphotransferase (APT) family kinase protein